MRAAATLLAIVVAGSALVHLPVTVVTWLTDGDFGWLGVAVITVLMPLLAWAVCHYAGRFNATRKVARFVPIAIVLGIWAAGPLFLLGATIFGNGMSVSSREAVSMLQALPLMAISSASYDGSLFGLILASAIVWFPNSAWRDV